MSTQYLCGPEDHGIGPWSEGGPGSTVLVVEIRDLVDVAAAGRGESDVVVTHLEPATLSSEAGPTLEMVLSELVVQVGGAAGCRLAGSWDSDDYLVTITWADAEMAIGVLDRLVQENELALAIASIARLARHQGMQVRFVPGPDAVTAQIAVPGSVVSHPAPTIGTSLPESADAAFVPHESERRVAVPAHSWLEESEAFLERVFAPLRLAQATASASGEGVVLQVRVPGERFVDMGDDSPSTVAAEAAVEIRSALTTFDQGRRSAEITG
jgi:hypothetical protein